MTARPVARYLARFGGQVEVETVADIAFIPSVMQEPPESTPDLVADAHGRGYAEGFEAANAAAALRLDQERLAAEEHLAAARGAWTVAEADRLAEKITDAGRQVETAIADSVAFVLRPFVEEILRKQAVDELVRAVAVLLADEERPVLKISGAADLLAAVRDKLPASHAAIEYVPNQAVDVCVVAKQTIIETRIGAWLERLHASVE